VRHVRRSTTFFVAVLSLALVAAGCGGGGGGGGAKGGRAVFRLGIVEPTAIDPYNSQESEGQLVTKNLYESLTTVDTGGQLHPGVATSWSKNAGCTQWTFHLRPGTKFSNGELVTAQSFIYGMTRAAKPAAASDTAEFMSDIQGYDEIHGGGTAKSAASSFSGLSAPDANTLVINLSQPNCEFDKKTLQPVYSPVPTSAGDAGPNTPFANMPIGNGKFKMKGPWQHDKSITLELNDLYYGTKAHLDEVDITILPASNASTLEYQNFQAGSADWARMDPAVLPQAKATFGPKGEFLHQQTFGMNYLLPIVFNAPMNSVNARKAVSMAIDRKAITEGVFKGFETPADSFVPPTLKAYSQPGVCTACTFDVAKAKQLAASAGLKPGSKVSLAFNTGGGHEAWTQAVKSQLETNLGLVVDYKGVPFKELLADEKANTANGLFRAAWSADYPAADDFLRPLLAKSSFPPGDNRGRYFNATFEDLINRGIATADDSQRIALYRQAEKIAIGDDLALIPLWYRDQYRVANNKYTNLRLDFFENPTLGDASPA
jgi:ABC-type oligopeptide transport system substrate-binding subunit